MHAFRPSVSSSVLATGAVTLFSGMVSAADQPDTATVPSMQVYHQCPEPVYCKSFALTGKSTPWELVPADTAKLYNYPTEQYNATVWCAKSPDENAYSWVKLSLDDATTSANTVSYTTGSYGAEGDRTQPPFSQGSTSIGPIDNGSNGQDRCGVIKCETGSTSCVETQQNQELFSCGADRDIRWSFCMGTQLQQTNTTVSAGVRRRATVVVRATSFVA